MSAAILRRLVAACALALASAVLVTPSAEATKEPDAPRVLLYGDSITMGSGADWTWRYRLWQALQGSGTSVDFVGPRNDLIEYATWRFGSQQYRNPAFDTDHAALAAQPFLAPTYRLGDLAKTYRPDVIVGFIGVNDLKHGATVAQLETEWRAQIAKARQASRGVAIVLVQLPLPWLTGVGDYNAMLQRLAAELDSAKARVVVTGLASWAPWDTYDYLHPTTSGERKVAAVVTQALAGLGIGTGMSLAAADPADDHTWAPRPSTSVVSGQATISWPAVTYATSEDIWVRDLTAGNGSVITGVTGTSRTFPVLAGHTYRVILLPVRTFQRLGTMSEPVDFTAPVSTS